jgi:hypothetical protein
VEGIIVSIAISLAVWYLRLFLIGIIITSGSAVWIT